MNWGKGLLLAYAAFIAVVLIMVSISISKDVDLVAPNYYDREIKYQEEINRINNTIKLDKDVSFVLSETTLNITFPAKSLQSVINGDILFYRPSESKKDFRVMLDVGNNYTQQVDISGIYRGLWKIKVMWNMDGTDYLSETSIIKQ